MVKTYDPKQVSVIIAGAIMKGFADSDFVSVDRNEDSWSLLMGADGESTRSKNANKSGKITVTLLASSESNDTLSQIHLADELTGRGLFPILVKDQFGRSLYTAATCWINKQPPGTFGKESGTREWVIETDELIQYTGGN